MASSTAIRWRKKFSLKELKNVRFFHFQYIADRREQIPTAKIALEKIFSTFFSEIRNLKS